MKSKYWGLLGILPLIILIGGWIIYLIVTRDHESLLYFVGFLAVFIMAFKWSEYCTKKQIKKESGKETYY